MAADGLSRDAILDKLVQDRYLPPQDADRQSLSSGSVKGVDLCRGERVIGLSVDEPLIFQVSSPLRRAAVQPRALAGLCGVAARRRRRVGVPSRVPGIPWFRRVRRNLSTVDPLIRGATRT